MIYAIIDKETGTVLNRIVLENEKDYTPPDGSYLVASEECTMGDTYDGKSFAPPKEPIVQPDPFRLKRDALSKVGITDTAAQDALIQAFG